MHVRRSILTLAILVIAAPTGGAEISFSRDVRPILADRCFHCHGPDAENQDSDFRLDSREAALADLGGYAGVVPGDLAASELHRRIRSADDDRMPPPDAVRQLTDAERDVLDAWILAGAPFDGHWSFQRLPKSVPVPEAGDWVRKEIDAFVLRRMQDAELAPNVEADKARWLRRVTFDLTGLPPTLAEIDAFLDDESDGAYQRVVDRLLASDACAERLTTEWLDVARYSDSYGYQRDDARRVWPWRDWVIAAFRTNMPYDQFITEQLAGDLLPGATRKQILATAFNRLHSHKKEGGVAIEEFRVENVADRTHTFAAAFLGLTLECARCHDHKYDPIATREYYQLSAFFANVDERGLISFFTDATPTPALALPTPEQEARLAEAAAAVAQAEAKLHRVTANADEAFRQWLGTNRSLDPRTEHANASDAGREPVLLPGLVASLSFDQFESLSAEESKNEDGGKVDPAEMHGLANDADGAARAVTSVANTLVPGKYGNAIRLSGDDPVVLPGVGRFTRDQPFTCSLWLNAPTSAERAVVYRRSRGWDDAGSVGYELTIVEGRLSAKLVHFWPGNAICVETTEPLAPQTWHHVAVTYDGSSHADGVTIFLDGRPAETTVVRDGLTRSITNWNGGHQDLAIGWRFRDRGFEDGLVDEFRVFDRRLTPLEAEQLYDGEALAAALGRPVDALKTNELDELRAYFVATRYRAAEQARTVLQQARRQRNAAMDATTSITVMRERPTPRQSYVLTRGAYDQRGEPVEPDTPEFLPAFPEHEPRNRLGLARWLTQPDHPLTARVTVNRYWQMIFGTGLVKTPEDFGMQGEAPSHLELLDWLSRDFVSHGWNVRRLLRTMVLSATYRQSSIVSPEVRSHDPENRLLARGPSGRLTAEMIRDNALAVSGLLVSKVGGPPVKPYDVALAYTPLPVDKGDGLYRRSLYTFWKRTAPAPVMITMDASKREVCRLRRETTASPLQALVLLNGPQFVEASRVLAGKLLLEHEGDVDAVVHEAFRRLTSREPSPEEASILRELYYEQAALFAASPAEADQLLATGEAPAAANLSAVEHAAATVLINAIMNLDESVRLR